MPKKRNPVRVNWRGLLLAAAALLLTIGGAWAFVAVQKRLPAQQDARLSAQTWADAHRSVLETSPAMRTAWDACQLSRSVTAAHVGRAPAREAASAASGLIRRTGMDLARLHLLSALLIDAGDDAPRDALLPQLKRLLAGVDETELEHRLGALIPQVAAAYIQVGVGEDLAWELAYDRFGYAHDPFLQICTAHLDELAQRFDAVDDAPAAQTCRALRDALLRQWLTEPGPMGLRLLAAELLARRAESTAPAVGGRRATGEQPSDLVAADDQSATGDSPATDDHAATSRESAAALRAWRASWREVAIARPQTPLVRLGLGLSVAPQAEQRLAAWLARSAWLVLAAATAGGVATVALACKPRGSAPRPAEWAVGLALAVIVGGALGVLAAREDALVALRRSGFPAETIWGWPGAWGVAVMVVALVAGARPWRGGWLDRVQGVSLVAWLGLGVASLGAGVWVEGLQRAYVDASVAGYRQELEAGVPDVDEAKTSATRDDNGAVFLRAAAVGFENCLRGTDLRPIQQTDDGLAKRASA